MKFFFLIAFFFCSFTKVSGQNNYWVFFKDKKDSQSKSGSSDNEDHLKKIASKNIRVIGYSKWFNAAYVSVKYPELLNRLEKLPFVKQIEVSKKYKTSRLETQGALLNYGQADVQINMLGLHDYHSNGNTGKGVVLALFDAGFYKVDSNLAFYSLRKRNGILATKDFVSGDSNVYDDNEHGMYVLSIIAGYIKDSLNGAAPDVSLVLARTEETGSERHSEEFNWVKALEWADSIGVDIIHSSLGYSLFDSLQGDYKYSDMDGQSTIITRAAQMAFERGIFITNSAGNEGKKTWKFITAPCDGKDVLCVGSVDSFQRKSDFSSFGPSADGRVKPDVMAMGTHTTIISTSSTMRRGNGTSFSGPLIAGFVACLKQSFPSDSNAFLLEAIRRSCDRYSTPSDSMGYGIPNIQRADSIMRKILKIRNVSNTAKFKAFPNPCSSMLKVTGERKIKFIEIFDIMGKKYPVIMENEAIDMTSFNPGVYFLKVGFDRYNEGFHSVLRILKI